MEAAYLINQKWKEKMTTYFKTKEIITIPKNKILKENAKK